MTSERRVICPVCRELTYVSPGGRFRRHSPGLGGRFHEGSYQPTWCIGSKQVVPEVYEIRAGATGKSSFLPFLATLTAIMDEES